MNLLPCLATGCMLLLASGPAASVEPPSCQPSPKEAKMAQLIREDRAQTRPKLSCSPTLEVFARKIAMDLSKRDVITTMDAEGHAANWRLRQAGYSLPPFYEDFFNNVLSIGSGQTDPESMYFRLLREPLSRAHLLGDEPEMQRQDQYGIAHIEQGPGHLGNIWVVVIARTAQAGDKDFYCGEDDCGDSFKPMVQKPMFHFKPQKTDEQLAKEKQARRENDRRGAHDGASILP